MEFTGIIKCVMPMQSGVSKKDPSKQWQSQTFVVEETNVQFPTSVAFSAFGQDKIDQCHIAQMQPGQRVTVFYDMYAREHNGFWSNDARAWRVDFVN